MTNFSATHWVNLSMATATGTTRLVWSAVHDISQTGTVTDAEPLGVLDASDMFRNTSFTGFHVTVDGKAYGVFRSGQTYAVPYNKDIHDIWGAPVFASGETTQYLMPLSGAANCFLGGTQLATPGGPRGIETLAPGDLVVQTSGPPVPVIWIWRQTVVNLPQIKPLIRLRAHSLGPGTPARDLVVTPDHAMGIGGMLVTAQALVNGQTIHEVAHGDLPQHYMLWHVEVAAHCLLLAENCPAESFPAYGDRDRFDGTMPISAAMATTAPSPRCRCPASCTRATCRPRSRRASALPAWPDCTFTNGRFPPIRRPSTGARHPWRQPLRIWRIAMAGEIPDLIAEARTGTGKGAARQARREGKVPGVVYGGGADPIAIQIPFNVLLKRLKQGRFMSTLFNLKVEGHDDVRVICRGVQRDVVKDMPTHVDLMRLRRTSRVALFIPVEFVNHEQSPGLKRGGVLTVVRPEVELVVTAGDIPDHITVDLAGRAIGDVIHISDVALPEGVTPTIDRDFVIANVSAPSGLVSADNAEAEEAAED